MIKILLFDLDGTLIDIDMRIFLKEYFREIGEHFSCLLCPRHLVDSLNASTRAMIENREKDKTNQEVFWEDFLPRVNLDEELVRNKIDEFYRHRFGKLKAFTNPRGEAGEAVETALELGYQLVMATNPVFPSSAILQRMEWAGVSGYPYKLVTTYENMHFCKPNPLYYQEILDRLGVLPGECLMLGNDVDDDLVASRVGIKVFIVEDNLINRSNRDCAPDYRGRLQELPDFLQKLKNRPGQHTIQYGNL